MNNENSNETPVIPTSPTSALIVDDLADNRIIFEIAVARAGYVVTCATNGQEALDILKNQTFQLMILDLDMPVLNGRDLLKILATQPEIRPKHVIVATANFHMTTEVVGDMADYVMCKPIELQSLITLTKRLNPTFSVT